MATEAARLERKKNLIERKKKNRQKNKNRLDTHRPSHGRHHAVVRNCGTVVSRRLFPDQHNPLIQEMVCSSYSPRRYTTRKTSIGSFCPARLYVLQKSTMVVDLTFWQFCTKPLAVSQRAPIAIRELIERAASWELHDELMPSCLALSATRRCARSPMSDNPSEDGTSHESVLFLGAF